MSTKAISLYFCVPAAFLLFFAHLNNPTTSFLRALLDLATPSFPFNLLTVHYFSNYHCHRGAYNPLCNDFPPDFPPPDTAATSIFCVDPNGCCDFTTVQSAVDAVPRSSQKRNVLWINKGIYLEKVTVPATKPNITFQGQGFDLTAIMWNDTANSSHGTFYSASVSVFATGFVAKNISFMNVAPIPRPGDVGAQAVALRIGGDQAAFWGCGFFGAQDTLHDDRGRHYFKECFIQGSIDFIFGDARSLYEIDFHSRSCACRGEIHHWFSYCACPGIQQRKHRLFICQLQHRRHRVDMARASMETLLPCCIRIHYDVKYHRLRWME
ncbi:probable pectinesterase 8 isoform X2 [Triticum aestivum]|uniref:probable pectinesterase 8 isoform X2 n=1 Tax=Triticum aestivum TaxID=4565 RepID=UPI001D005319|nr:probable pectinesterase 8 isoform X2 [Triticum aestivum]